ncbi:MAG: SLC13 family permease [Nitrospirae bacterium]|nr:MAG: SLC13 family permease [Nitrospirota bacterium]
MTPEIAFVLALCGLSVVLFATEWLPYDLVAVGIMVALGVSGILTPREALAGFANPAVVTVGAMFVLAAGVLRTGALAAVERRLAALARGEASLLLYTTLLVGIASAFVNSTPVVVVFIPVLLGIAHERRIAPSRLLMPISFAAILGGGCTLIGTSTNILISELVTELGEPPLEMFELAPLGLLLAAVGLAYLLLAAPRLLPEVETATALLGLKRGRHYVSEIRIGADSDLVGRPLRSTFAERFPHLQLLDVVRDGVSLWELPPPVLLQEGDCLVVRGDLNALLEVHRDEGVELLPGVPRDSLRFDLREMVLAELVLTPNSTLLGRTLAEAQFHRRHRLHVMGIMRHGRHIAADVAHQPLLLGDILLVFGTPGALAAAETSDDFLRLDGVHEAYVNRRKAPITVAVIVAVVATLTLHLLPLPMVALAGAGVLILTGCLSLPDAYRSLEGRVLVLVAGTLALGLAMERSGAGAWVAHRLVAAVGPWGPVAVLAALYLITTVFTEIMSNNATAVLMVPIAVATAADLGVDPRPMIMAVLFGASASFASPIGYKTNTLVYGPGGYRYADFLRLGLPLKLLFWPLASLLIPHFWPLVR